MYLYVYNRYTYFIIFLWMTCIYTYVYLLLAEPNAPQDGILDLIFPCFKARPGMDH